MFCFFVPNVIEVRFSPMRNKSLLIIAQTLFLCIFLLYRRDKSCVITYFDLKVDFAGSLLLKFNFTLVQASNNSYFAHLE